MEKKALLVVSFGTSYEETRKLTIDAIEDALASAFPDFQVYRAWTSKMIIRKIQKRDGMHINTVSEALEEMIREGITDVVVQPTHILNGIENDLMKEDVLAKADSFHSVSFGDPLLTTTEDAFAIMKAIIQEFSDLKDDEALVLVGHGTSHYSNMLYPALNDILIDLGHPNILVGTVEAYPDMDRIVEKIKALAPKKVIITPLMIVAGDHANNDIGGDEEDSWVNTLCRAGFQAEAVLRGLGEYPEIHQLLIQHAQKANSDQK